MLQSPVHPSRSRAPLRAPLSLFLVFSGLLLTLGLLAVALIFSYPRADIFIPGLIGDFPPSDQPYVFQNQRFFLVNTGQDLLALSDEHPDPPYCRIRWIPQEMRFIEPCRGTQFSLDGLYISGPPATMSHYPVDIVAGQVRVDLSRRQPGPPVSYSWSGP